MRRSVGLYFSHVSRLIRPYLGMSYSYVSLSWRDHLCDYHVHTRFSADETIPWNALFIHFI